MLSELSRGADAAFAVDGPRGPRERAKPGAARTAELGGAALLPVSSAACRSIVLKRTWDRFELPLPFSRVVVVVGAPLDVEEARVRPDTVAEAIAAAQRRAEAVAMGGRAWQR